MESSDDSAGKRDGEVEQEGEHVANPKRLKGSIAVEAFSCGVCAQLLTPPIFQVLIDPFATILLPFILSREFLHLHQCSSGPFICSSCRDKLPDKNKCPFCSGCALARSLGMERAARSILVDCRYAERGCTEKMAFDEQNSHEKVCAHAPCLCPEPGCGFAGRPGELLDHLTGHHGWPSTTFDYWKAFDLRVDKPGAQVLCCEEDGQLFLVNATPTARPPGRAVSLVGVPPYLKPTGFGCRVEFSCFCSHRGTTALDDIQPLRLSDWPPTTEFLCVLPQVSDVENEASVVVPTVSITFVCDWWGESDSDDSNSYIESDEDDSDYS
jgi:E3 ubiquitin-protein ligase SIAH1